MTAADLRCCDPAGTPVARLCLPNIRTPPQSPVGPENFLGLHSQDLQDTDSCGIGLPEILLATRCFDQRPSRFVKPVNSRSTSGYQHHGLACHFVQHASRDHSLTSIPADREPGPSAPARDLSTNLSAATHTGPRSHFLVLALPRLARMARCRGDRIARDRHSLAQTEVPGVLD